MFIYDRTTRCGKLSMGDSGWESPYDICDSEIVGLNLTPLEQSWLRLCWQAATWSSTQTVTEIFEQSHIYVRPEPESWVFKCNPGQWLQALFG